MHKIGWHIGNIIPFDDGQKSVIRAVPPCCVTFIAGEGFWPEHMRWILEEVNPGCHFVFRPYFAPSDNPRAYQGYIDAVAALIDQPAWDFIPPCQRHLQVFNEQNMPRWSQWEGFGDTVDDMRRFNDWFIKAYQKLKAANPTFKVGWTPLTIGNRDAWFPGDEQNVAYYMHGPGAARPNPTEGEIAAAIRSGPCYESLRLADEYYCHIYCINEPQKAIHEPWYGLRFAQYARFFPKPMDIWITENGIGQPYSAYGEWYDLLDGYPAVQGTSIWILGHEIKSVTHPAVQYLRQYIRDRVEPPTPEPEPPSGPSIDEAVRNSAWNKIGVSYNVEAAFSRYARVEDLGMPMADEYDLEVGGFKLRVQPYAGGIVVCEVGKWEQVTHLEWL